MVVGVGWEDMSKWLWLASHDLRKLGGKAPLGADSGPGEMAIMLPVLARCIDMSLSGGRGAVRGVLEPDVVSRSNAEYRLLLVVFRPAERLPKPWLPNDLLSFALRRLLRNS